MQFVNFLNYDMPPAPSAQFFHLLVGSLVRFGELKNRGNALGAVLKASKSYVGVDKKPYFALLIQEWQFQRQKGSTFIPGAAHDVVISYAFRDNKLVSASDEGRVTKFAKNLCKRLN